MVLSGQAQRTPTTRAVRRAAATLHGGAHGEGGGAPTASSSSQVLYGSGGSVERSDIMFVTTVRIEMTPSVTRAGVAVGLIQKPR